jgi:hypothetical protein
MQQYANQVALHQPRQTLHGQVIAKYQSLQITLQPVIAAQKHITNSPDLGKSSNLGNATSSSISNIPHYSSTPKARIQRNYVKPGLASSKPTFNNKPSKGSADPIRTYNKFGSLDDMDLEVSLSPRKGPAGRMNQ